MQLLIQYWLVLNKTSVQASIVLMLSLRASETSSSFSAPGLKIKNDINTAFQKITLIAKKDLT